MTSWDTSALVPLLVREAGSPLARSWLAEDPGVVTWSWTHVELRSAIERRGRDGTASKRDRAKLLGGLTRLAAGWDEVASLAAVRERALTLLARHPLRAADAAQLGAALLVANEFPGRLGFVCLDTRLAEAAEREDLDVCSWPG